MGRLLVHSMFPTVQGEGSAVGTPCVFLRLSGCNLWSGLEEGRGRGRGACARWCDTEFHGGTALEPEEVLDQLAPMWAGAMRPVVVVTGGEPLLHLRRPPGEALVRLLLDQGVEVHLETNGTTQADVLPDLHHVTVSPKALASPGEDALGHVVVRTGTDLKVVHPQWTVLELISMAAWDFPHRFIQPLDPGDGWRRTAQANLEESVQVAHAIGWRVSVQAHKLVGWP